MVGEHGRQRADPLRLGRTSGLDPGKPDLASIGQTKAAAIDDLGDMAFAQFGRRA